MIVKQIQDELIITYKQAAQPIDELKLIEEVEEKGTDPEAGRMPPDDSKYKCSAVVFAEKLFTQRNLYGTIKAICKTWKPSQEAMMRWENTGGDPKDDPRPI